MNPASQPPTHPVPFRHHWTLDRAIAVAIGGAIGASTRWAVFNTFDDGTFPWVTLVVNVAGSFLLGVLMAIDPGRLRARTLAHDLGAIGFCGGLTTFSTFAVEVVRLMDAGSTTTAIIYAVVSVMTTLAAVSLGALVFRRLGAVRGPLEEVP